MYPRRKGGNPVVVDELDRRRLFIPEPLQFFVLFSSVSAVVPSLAVGNGDYAMANAYMDYVAQVHARALPIMSIQWPSWKESGMGENHSPIYGQLGFLSLSDEEGLSLLDQLLPQRAVTVLPAMTRELSAGRTNSSAPSTVAADPLDVRCWAAS